MFDWNDLKYLLAIARHGSTIAAGEALRVSQSTVHRRVSELERRLGQPLVTRQTTGYRLTDFGRELLPFAERIEAAVRNLEQHIDDDSRNKAGIVRLTCPEPIIPRLAPFIEAFHKANPRIRIDFVTSDRYLDLLKGEADIALRSGDTEDELVGRKVAESTWAVYASEDFVQRQGRPESVQDLSRYPLVSFDDTMARHRVVQWLHQVAPDASIVARNNSVLGLIYAVKSGLGIGPLPMAIADNETGLVRVLGSIPELNRSWRLLTRPEIRHMPPVAAFFTFVSKEHAALQKILAG